MTTPDRVDAVPVTEKGAVLWRGVAVIVALGAVLGIAQNALMRRGEDVTGLKDIQRRSLTWIREEQTLVPLPASSEPESSAGAVEVAGTLPTPLSESSEPAQPSPSNVNLPLIPSLPQPMEVQLALVKAYVDQDAAAIIDARPRDQFDEGHIPGAVSMPFEEVVTDPARLESFDAQGKPIIVYCGGGNCETSKNLAFAMLQAGQKRLVVFTGGFPEWSEAGYPVATAAGSGKSS